MNLPCILRVGTQHVVIEVCVLLAIANGARLRIAQQEVCEVVPGTGYGDSVLELAGDFTGKVERTAPVGITIRGQIVPAEIRAELKTMLPVNQVDAIAKVLALIAGEHRYAITQRAEIGEVEGRWSIVDRIRGCSLNTKLLRHVWAIGKVWNGVGVIAIKDHLGVV